MYVAAIVSFGQCGVVVACCCLDAIGCVGKGKLCVILLLWLGFSFAAGCLLVSVLFPPHCAGLAWQIALIVLYAIGCRLDFF